MIRNSLLKYSIIMRKVRCQVRPNKTRSWPSEVRMCLSLLQGVFRSMESLFQIHGLRIVIRRKSPPLGRSFFFPPETTQKVLLEGISPLETNLGLSESGASELKTWDRVLQNLGPFPQLLYLLCWEHTDSKPLGDPQ